MFSMSQPWAFSAIEAPCGSRPVSRQQPSGARRKPERGTASKASKGSQMGTVMLEMPRLAATPRRRR